MKIVPDLAAEVISPGDLACELQEKIEEYLQQACRCSGSSCRKYA